MKRILLCCGTGVATSTIINKKVEEELNKRGYKGQFTIDQCKLAEMPAKSKDYDLCISTIANKLNCGCPIIIATNLLLNRNVKETYDKIEEMIKE